MNGNPPIDAPSSVDADPLIGTVLASRYRVEKLLGSGGMGSVYLAQHVKLQKPMAVKVLHKEMSTVHEVVARFEREAIAAARIDHPNVAAATDVGMLEDGSFFLVLEYIAGRSLRSALVPGAMPVPRALRILRQIADALSAAHEAGIVHRDLKPENVMLLDRRGRTDVVKVLDFGIAKVTYADAQSAPQLTRMGSVFGTPEYMAPEQAAGQTVDSRADLYALGVLLFEMLDGRPPFEGGDPVAVVQMQIRDAPPPLPPSTHPEVVQLTSQLLAKKAGDRVQTAEEVVRRIDRLLPLLAETTLPMVEPTLPIVDDTPRAPGAAPDSLPVSAVGDTLFAIQSPASVASPQPPSVSNDRTRGTVVSVRRDDAEPIDKALTRTVLVGPVRVRLWMVGAAAMALMTAGLLVMVLVIGLITGTRREEADSPPAREPPAVPAVSSAVTPQGTEVGQPLDAAAAGDEQALARLEAQPEPSRSPAVWLALAKGRTRRGSLAGGAAAYERALSANPSLADDTALRDLRRAADDPSSWDTVVRIASTSLGESGPDLIYDVYSAAGGKGDGAKRAADALGTQAIRSKASAALKVALALRETKGCPELKALLPDVKSAGDLRCAPVLDRLSATKGCGFLGLGDCYSCLRKDSSLRDAASAAKARPGPRFR